MASSFNRTPLGAPTDARPRPPFLFLYCRYSSACEAPFLPALVRVSITVLVHLYFSLVIGALVSVDAIHLGRSHCPPCLFLCRQHFGVRRYHPDAQTRSRCLCGATWCLCGAIEVPDYHCLAHNSCSRFCLSARRSPVNSHTILCSRFCPSARRSHVNSHTILVHDSRPITGSLRA